VGSLPFPDASFDLVVSALSMHHWAEPEKGLAEIGRVLRPGGRALVWDLRSRVPSHAQAPDLARIAGLRLVRSTPWRWPWGSSLLTRLELLPRPRRDDGIGPCEDRRAISA
jgi:SAM-dependent methyltransferase